MLPGPVFSGPSCEAQVPPKAAEPTLSKCPEISSKTKALFTQLPSEGLLASCSLHPPQGPAPSTEAHRTLPLHGLSTEGGTLPATQGLTIEISCAVSVPGVGCVSYSDLFWSATLQHVCADLRKKEAPSCPSEAAAALLAREREAQVPAVLPVSFWDPLQWK